MSTQSSVALPNCTSSSPISISLCSLSNPDFLSLYITHFFIVLSSSDCVFKRDFLWLKIAIIIPSTVRLPWFLNGENADQPILQYLCILPCQNPWWLQCLPSGFFRCWSQDWYGFRRVIWVLDYVPGLSVKFWENLVYIIGDNCYASNANKSFADKIGLSWLGVHVTILILQVKKYLKTMRNY